MAKQRLEGDVRNTLKFYSVSYSFYFMKLHNNPMAHQTTPGDFLILCNNKNILFECKQTKTSSFDFNRLTQLDDMEIFNDFFQHNSAYIIIMFYKGRLDKSDIYLINVDEFVKFKLTWKKNSINDNEACVVWNQYKIPIYKGGILRFERIFNSSK